MLSVSLGAPANAVAGTDFPYLIVLSNGGSSTAINASIQMVLPAGTRRGHGRDDMGAYLGSRGVADRAHVVLRQSRDGDVEFLYGRVTDGGTTTGRFLAGARVGSDGLIASYEVTFDTEHVLVDDA